jgi:hypothetical protein
MDDKNWYNDLKKHFRKKIFTKTEQFKMLPREYRDILNEKYLEKMKKINEDKNNKRG